MKTTESYIILHEMRFFAYHGALPQEAITGNTYLVNLRLKVDCTDAILTDVLHTTLNYAEAYEVVKAEMDIPSQLLEHVAGRIAKQLFSAFPIIEEIHLDLAKLNPPLPGADLHSARIELHCTQ